MKYIVLVGDGMCDYPIAELGNKTPLEFSKTPNMDYLASHGKIGLAKTVPEGMSPASDVANLAIFGYDPEIYYTGRGPLEAANLGVRLQDDDVAFRCNLITADEKMLDYSAGHISTKEASILIKYLDEKIGSDEARFYPGTSYRHLAVIKNKGLKARCVPPHDITGRQIKKYLPRGEDAKLLLSLMEASRKILPEHEVNHVRLDLKENPANMIWLWGQGKRPNLPLLKDKYGIASGAVISAVDLIKGIGLLAGLEVIKVVGATGYYDTNYRGKADAAIFALQEKDFVYVHVEAPDEASHNGELQQKIIAIERFDELIVGTILKAFKGREDFRVLLMPDHATPVSLRTHTADNVCFAMFGKGISASGAGGFNEIEAQKSGIAIEKASILMDRLIKEEEI